MQIQVIANIGIKVAQILIGRHDFLASFAFGLLGQFLDEVGLIVVVVHGCLSRTDCVCFETQRLFPGPQRVGVGPRLHLNRLGRSQLKTVHCLHVNEFVFALVRVENDDLGFGQTRVFNYIVGLDVHVVLESFNFVGGYPVGPLPLRVDVPFVGFLVNLENGRHHLRTLLTFAFGDLLGLAFQVIDYVSRRVHLHTLLELPFLFADFAG